MKLAPVLRRDGHDRKIHMQIALTTLLSSAMLLKKT